MKGKLIGIIVILAILGTMLLGLSYRNGFNATTTSNPMSSYDSIASLQSSIPFKFQVPAIVANGKNLKLYNYMNIMAEIQSDEFTFRAAPYIDEKADVSGDYSSYTIDEQYTSNNEGVNVRYRANDKNTLVNISTLTDGSWMTYSIKFNSILNKEDAFEKLGIDYSNLAVRQDKQIEQNDTKETDNKDESNSNNSEYNIGNEDKNSELEFTLYKSDELEISFMLPKLKSDLTGIYSNNQIAFMMGNELIFVVEYYERGYQEQQFNGFTINKLDENYIIRYEVNNRFSKDTQLYEDYYTIIENMNTIANTFNREN